MTSPRTSSMPRFEVVGLGLKPCVLDSTSDINLKIDKFAFKVLLTKTLFQTPTKSGSVLWKLWKNKKIWRVSTI